MTIAETSEKCKAVLARIPRDVLVLGVLLLVSSLSFALGLLTGLEIGQGDGRSLSEFPTVTDFSITTPTPAGVGAPTEASGFVASKSGTKYYLPECSGADRISSANKIFFASASAAVAAGYAPAANCKGL